VAFGSARPGEPALTAFMSIPAGYAGFLESGPEAVLEALGRIARTVGYSAEAHPNRPRYSRISVAISLPETLVRNPREPPPLERYDVRSSHPSGQIEGRPWPFALLQN
jgi:hypothetical protein